MTEKQTKPSVLLVDDDSDFLFQQQVQLEAAGYEVITAANEHQARKVLDQRRPDLAVLDVMMDQPDAGFTLSYHIRKTDPSIPIILVTAITRETGMEFDLTGASDRAWIRADAILAKPIRFEQLKREIDRLLASPAPAAGSGQ
jgi:CheY-like chemotaxis protein